ncbi:MAG: CO2 hydration protein, partial [Vulcanococcus sp.]
MSATIAPELTKAPLIPPSTHRYADVIHRLESGGSMLPDTPENLKQIIGIYKAYAVPMDFYWRDLLYIA